MANKLKTFREQPNRGNLHVWNSHRPIVNKLRIPDIVLQL